MICEVCGRWVWGVGVVGGVVFEVWEDKIVFEDSKRKEIKVRKEEEEGISRGKGKSLDIRLMSMLVEGLVIYGDGMGVFLSGGEYEDG